ncbi:MAG: phosphatase PAP2 family protein [Bacteroidales bacterium]|nr:phosphatase PAP2 family protein [Bacteroidales bacterium]
MKLSRSQYIFFTLTLIYLIAGIPLLLIDKGIPSLWINERHHQILDFFFKNYTYLGGGIMIGLVLLYFIIYNRRNFIIFGTAAGLLSILVQLVFKKFLFEDIERPASFFKESEILNFVEGVNMHYHYSFPSGHTSLAFLIATSLILLYPKRKLGISMFIFAFTIGISRIYLFQHFFIDTYFGTITGVTVALMVFGLFSYLEKRNRFPSSILNK